jgi:hypothetical protein
MRKEWEQVLSAFEPVSGRRMAKRERASERVCVCDRLRGVMFCFTWTLLPLSFSFFLSLTRAFAIMKKKKKKPNL